MTGNFNIRDSNWNSDYPYHLAHSNLLFDIANTFNLSFHILLILFPLDTQITANSNSVIDLMFLRPNSSELNNHSILSESQYPLDHASLVVVIQIIKEFIPDIKYTIIKNNKEKMEFTSNIIKNFKKINTLHLINKKSLEVTVQEITRTQEKLWCTVKKTKRMFFDDKIQEITNPRT